MGLVQALGALDDAEAERPGRAGVGLLAQCEKTWSQRDARQTATSTRVQMMKRAPSSRRSSARRPTHRRARASPRAWGAPPASAASRGSWVLRARFSQSLRNKTSDAKLSTAQRCRYPIFHSRQIHRFQKCEPSPKAFRFYEGLGP